MRFSMVLLGCGFALTVAGCALVFYPLGLIVAGVGLGFYGLTREDGGE